MIIPVNKKVKRCTPLHLSISLVAGVGFEGDERREALYLFLAIATVIKPKTPIPIAGPIVLSARKVHTANAMQSSPTINLSFLISTRPPALPFVV